MKNILKLTLLFGFIGLAPAIWAQGPGPGGPIPTTPPTPTAIPIDGGASLLIAGGVALGLKKLRDHRKNGKKI